VMVGGTVEGPGNIRPAVEFNMFCDPASARAVFRAPCTKTLIPLDVTNRVVLTFDFLNQLPPETTRVGGLLRKIVPPAFRAYRQESGLEGIHVHDTVALLSVMSPELFRTQAMAGDVETKGELTTGATVFDRRRVPGWRCNMDVAVDMNVPEVVEKIVHHLAQAGKATAA
jgi:inosine-uridine nucleoside N-ribohydrolase